MQRYELHKGHPLLVSWKRNAIAFIERLPDSHSWVIEIKRLVKERTHPQNRALFGLAYPAIKKVTGDDIDDLHRAFCGKFFGWVDYEVMGELERRPYRTTTTNADGEREVMEPADFAEFYNAVQRIAASAGIDVPDPDPLHGIEQRWAA